jgi:O-antigen/teichoic acid export membrane protein
VIPESPPLAPTEEAPAAFALRLFVKSAGILSISSLASLVRAVVTAKLFAVALGPSAVGILSQLLNFSAFLFTVLPLGLTTGVAKMTAEAHGDRLRLDIVVGTSSAISLASGLAAALILTPLSTAISNALTGSGRYSFLVLLIVWSFPLNNLAGVLGYVLQGMGDVGRLTWANVATSLATLALVVPLTIEYRLLGAVISVLVASVLQAAIFAWALWSAYRSRGWKMFRRRVSRAVSVELLRYGGVMLLAGMAIWGSVLITRTMSVRLLGEYQNGIYQVAFGLSGQYMAVFMTWMGAYVFPRVTATLNGSRLSTLLNSGLRANFFLMVPILVISIAIRDPLIKLFYSSAFLSASPLLPVQALGDYARVIGWSFGVALFAQGRTGSYLTAVVAQSAAWVVLAWVLLPLVGIEALVIGYALSSLLWPALMYPFARRHLKVGISAENALLAGLGLLVLVAALAIPQPFGLMLIPVLPAVVYLRRGSARLF